jgi:hypothetical protein
MSIEEIIEKKEILINNSTIEEIEHINFNTSSKVHLFFYMWYGNPKNNKK